MGDAHGYPLRSELPGSATEPAWQLESAVSAAIALVQFPAAEPVPVAFDQQRVTIGTPGAATLGIVHVTRVGEAHAGRSRDAPRT